MHRSPFFFLLVYRWSSHEVFRIQCSQAPIQACTFYFKEHSVGLRWSICEQVNTFHWKAFFFFLFFNFPVIKLLWRIQIKEHNVLRHGQSHWGPTLEPGLGKRLFQEHRVAGLTPKGLGQAKPKQNSLSQTVCPPVGPPSAGKAIWDGCQGRGWRCAHLVNWHWLLGHGMWPL